MSREKRDYKDNGRCTLQEDRENGVGECVGNGEMGEMRETLLSVHRAIDKPKLSNNKKITATYFNNISMAKIREDIEIELEHMLPHLDLAVGNDIQPTRKICSQNASVSCQNLRKKL